jgi:hypothetical protein
MENHKGTIIVHLVIIFLVISVSSCDTTESTISDPLNRNKNTFFPLSVGNKWFYNSYQLNDPDFDSTKFDRTWEVISTKTLGNKIFYQIESIRYNNDSTIFRIDSLYYAVRDDSLFLINPGQPFSETSVQLRALYNSEQYQHFIVQPDSDGNYLGYLINKTDSTNSFYYYQEGWMDSGWQMTFKKKVGYIESHSDWGLGSKLVKYILE